MYEGVPGSRDCIRTKYLLNFWSKRGAECLTGCISDHSRGFLIIKVYKRTTVFTGRMDTLVQTTFVQAQPFIKLLIQKSRSNFWNQFSIKNHFFSLNTIPTPEGKMEAKTPIYPDVFLKKSSINFFIYFAVPNALSWSKAVHIKSNGFYD